MLYYVISFYFVSFIPDLLKDFENGKKSVLSKDTAYSWKRNGKDKEEKVMALLMRVTRHSAGEREREETHKW